MIRSMAIPGFNPGTNSLAVEVHQSSTAGGDVLFGARLIAIVSAHSLPQLQIGRDPGSRELTLSWTGSAVLEETSNFPANWSISANQSNPQTFSPSEGARFYRLRW